MTIHILESSVIKIFVNQLIEVMIQLMRLKLAINNSFSLSLYVNLHVSLMSVFQMF